MSLFPEKVPSNFTSILTNLSISICKFDLNRCDECTFFIPVRFWYENHFVFGELIYLLDREDFFSALSLNNSYANVQHFFKIHFNYALLHTDEMQIARLVATNPKFHEYIQQYKIKFPNRKVNLFYPASVSRQN